MLSAPTHSRRRLIYLVLGAFGVVLVAVNAYTFLPFVEAARRMDAFCDQLAAGTTLEGLRAQAGAQGYEVTVEPGGRVVVDDPGSGGRRQCSLLFGAPSRADPAASH